MGQGRRARTGLVVSLQAGSTSEESSRDRVTLGNRSNEVLVRAEWRQRPIGRRWSKFQEIFISNSYVLRVIVLYCSG